MVSCRRARGVYGPRFDAVLPVLGGHANSYVLYDCYLGT